MADDDNFLSRWSRRKVQAKRGEPVAAPEMPVPPVSNSLAHGSAAAAGGAMLPAAQAGAPLTGEPETGDGVGHRGTGTPGAAETPPLTLDDVAALSKDSDYSRFVAGNVDPDVKNAAMKKLFASDPHFNQMDGLDVYIDDYNRFEPVPRNLLRQLVNARAMGFLDDELPEQPAPHNPAPAHEDTDLQLQPHDAAGQPGIEPGPAGGADRSDGAAPGVVPPRSA
jgi:Protein of unknown function (DUF3306)